MDCRKPLQGLARQTLSDAELGAMNTHLIRLLDDSFPDSAFADLGQLSGDYNTERCEEAYVSKFFEDRPWHSVTLTALRSEYEGDPSACLSFMSDEAFAYYLPAFVLICIQDFKGADVIPLSVVSSIAIDSEQQLSRLRRFTHDQLAVLREFVRYVSDELQNEFPGPKRLLVAAADVLTTVLQNGKLGGGSTSQHGTFGSDGRDIDE